MEQRKYFFIVSAIAILSCAGANAATVTGLATPNYVDGAVGALNAQLKAVAKTGSYNDLTNKPTLGSLAAKSNVTESDISGSISQGKIDGLTTALAGKQPTLTTGDSGNIKGSGSVTVTKDASGVITVSGTDTKYTLPNANGATLGGVKTGGDMTATSGTLTINTNAVTSAKIADNTIVNADIASNAAIAVSKINGAQTTGNMVKAVADINVGNENSTTNYPSMAVAQEIAKKAMASDITGLRGDVDGLLDDVQALRTWQGNVNAETTTGNGMVKTVSYDGTTGTITATRETVKTADIENKNVTKDKLADAVQTSLGKADTALQKAANATLTSGHILKADASGNVVDGGALGTLATKSTVTAAELSSNAVTTVKISDKNVTKAKLEDSVQTSLGKADTALQSVSGGSAVNGKVATAVVKSGTAVAVTMDYVKIPVGSPTAPTSVAQIWVQ